MLEQKPRTEIQHRNLRAGEIGLRYRDNPGRADASNAKLQGKEVEIPRRTEGEIREHGGIVSGSVLTANNGKGIIGK